MPDSSGDRVVKGILPGRTEMFRHKVYDDAYAVFYVSTSRVCTNGCGRQNVDMYLVYNTSFDRGALRPTGVARCQHCLIPLGLVW